MSFPDPPPPPPFMLPPFACGGIDDFCPQIDVNVEPPDSHFQFESAPPFKKQRNYGNNPSESKPLQPMNRRTNPANRPANQGTSHIFYKTRICLKFLDGKCRNGDHCTFAHGAEDMRDPPPNWQEIVRAHEKDKGAGNWNDDQRIIHRMRICRRFYYGEECPYGDKCNFIHENPSKFKTEIGRLRESSAISIGTTGTMMEHGSGSGQSDGINKHVNPTSDAVRVDMKSAYWKTKLCTKWETTGQCLFGEKCHFAHGRSELQVLGAQMEAEAVNALSIPTQPAPVPTNDVPPSKMVAEAPAKDGEGKKYFGKWKGPKKIDRIYADWIDDLPPPPLCLPYKVET